MNLAIFKLKKILNKLEVSLVDKLYYLYEKDHFSNISIDQIQEPELFLFIEQSKEKPRFNNYPKHKLEYFVERIYELSNNRQ